MTLKLPRRQALGLAAACLLAAAHPATLAADPFPARPVTLVLGFAPGGAGDVMARVLADELGKRLGQRVLVDNRSGAGGNLATQAVVAAPADGHTLLFAAINLATNPALMGVKYDPEKDLTMVAQVTSVPVVMLVPGTSPLKSPADVVSAARSGNGLRVGSGGNGTSSHLAAELFMRAHRLPMLHVPYRGGAPANQALVAGETELMFDLMSGTLKSMIDAQRIRPLAVMQDNRIAALPGVPSAKELGLPASAFIRSWQGIAVRSGTPQPVVAKLHEAVTAAAQAPAVRERLEQLGSELSLSKTPQDFQQHYRAELARWSALIKSAEIKSE